MDKSAQPGEGVWVHAHPPFTISTITYKVEVYLRSNWEGRYIPPISILPLYCVYSAAAAAYSPTDGWLKPDFVHALHGEVYSIQTS